MSTYSNYPAPPPPQQYYQAAPPPPHMYANGGYAAYQQQQQHEHAIATDPATFRHFYMSRLSSLTINSRPIIQDLSLLAMTHQQRMSQVVVQCIENHIRMVSQTVFIHNSPYRLQKRYITMTMSFLLPRCRPRIRPGFFLYSLLALAHSLSGPHPCIKPSRWSQHLPRRVACLPSSLALISILFCKGVVCPSHPFRHRIGCLASADSSPRFFLSRSLLKFGCRHSTC